MKFWQKIFFSTLIVFVIIFDIGAWIIVDHSYKFNVEREEQSAVREHNTILSSVVQGIDNAEKIQSDAAKNDINLIAVLSPLGTYYSPNGIKLGLYNETKEVYQSGMSFDKEILTFKNELNTNVADQKINGARYLFVVTKVPRYEHLTFLYARDITGLDNYRQEIGKVFIWLNIAVFIVLGAAIYIILKKMTLPLKHLNKATNEIAKGAYDKRVEIKSKDELGELADNFNSMANSVEDNIGQLQKAAEEKQRFIDNLAHEMKTPLTAILGYSEFLQKANHDEAERVTAAGHLHDAAERLNNLSAKLLEITMLQHEDFLQEEVNIEALFDALEGTMGSTLSGRNLTLETNTEIECITGDETLLLSLLCNLTENSARASGNGGAIRIWAYMGDTPVIEVADRGCGMEQAEIDKINEPFYRVDKSRSRAFGGIGLGMSICKYIADLHGASLEIKSELGTGTTVKVVFTTP